MNFASVRRSLFLALVVAALFSSVNADSYTLMLKGQKTGVIKGGVTQRGREGSIQVLQINHDIISPRDPASGLPTGRRQHKPIIVTIPLDQSIPVLYNVLCTNENLTSFELKYWGAGNLAQIGPGQESVLFSIKLTNANIADIDQIAEKDQAGISHQYFKISFSYQKIEWTWTRGGITATDDWETRAP
jgi:type VI secretion system secreted protein Hcp